MSLWLMTVIFLIVAVAVGLVVLAAVALPHLRGQDEDGTPLRRDRHASRTARKHSSRTGGHPAHLDAQAQSAPSAPSGDAPSAAQSAAPSSQKHTSRTARA